jgi:hypothetical protein
MTETTRPARLIQSPALIVTGSSVLITDKGARVATFALMTCVEFLRAGRDPRPGAALLPWAILQPPISRTVQPDAKPTSRPHLDGQQHQRHRSQTVSPTATATATAGAASAVTAANAVAKLQDNARPMRTAVESPSWAARTATDGPGRCAHSYGSDARHPQTRSYSSPRAPRTVEGTAGQLVGPRCRSPQVTGSRTLPGQSPRHPDKEEVRVKSTAANARRSPIGVVAGTIVRGHPAPLGRFRSSRV